VSRARVAVVQFPGVNCEGETLRALARAGLEAELFRWTRPARELAAFDAYVLPGGFSWQDRVRAGALAAKDPMLEELAARADVGAPILGICNGAQVLVEAGLVPGPADDGGAATTGRVPAGGSVEVALARNRMPERDGYYTRWVRCRVEDSPCVFTRSLEPGTVLPLPVAHGEGRFVAAKKGRLEELAARGQAPLRYASADGGVAEAFPSNPNGAEAAVAGLCNARGNVLALMPHPERAVELGQLSRAMGGEWGARRDRAQEAADDSSFGEGPGMVVFRGLARHLEGA
jgi:phosphoribosylformylglycinamidine synthase